MNYTSESERKIVMDTMAEAVLKSETGWTPESNRKYLPWTLWKNDAMPELGIHVHLHSYGLGASIEMGTPYEVSAYLDNMPKVQKVGARLKKDENLQEFGLRLAALFVSYARDVYATWAHLVRKAKKIRAERTHLEEVCISIMPNKGRQYLAKYGHVRLGDGYQMRTQQTVTVTLVNITPGRAGFLVGVIAGILDGATELHMHSEEK